MRLRTFVGTALHATSTGQTAETDRGVASGHQPPVLVDTRRGDALVTGAAALAASALFAKLSPGRSLKATFIPAMGAAYGCHLLTTNRATPDPERVLPLYLVALTTQFLHLTEEFGTEFYRRWPEEIFHAPPMSPKKHVAINMVSYAVFTLGALGIFRRARAPMLIVWFFTLMGVVGNAIQHPLYAAKVKGYFPGLYTSFVYWLLGPALVKQLWEARHAAPVGE